MTGEKQTALLPTLHLRRFGAEAGQRARVLGNLRADAYLKGGCGSLVGFELKGGVEAGKRFIDALKLFYHVANIGDARLLAIHPASTTHQQLNAEDQLAAGVTPGYVRFRSASNIPKRSSAISRRRSTPRRRLGCAPARKAA